MYQWLHHHHYGHRLTWDIRWACPRQEYEVVNSWRYKKIQARRTSSAWRHTFFWNPSINRFWYTSDPCSLYWFLPRCIQSPSSDILWARARASIATNKPARDQSSVPATPSTITLLSACIVDYSLALTAFCINTRALYVSRLFTDPNCFHTIFLRANEIWRSHYQRLQATNLNTCNLGPSISWVFWAQSCRGEV